MKNCNSYLGRQCVFIIISILCVGKALAFNSLSLFGDPPVILNVPNDTIVNCIGDIPASVSLMATDDDDLSFPKMIVSIDNPLVEDLNTCSGRVLFRVWVAEDAEGNITRDTQRITLLPDNGNPIIDIEEVHDTVACEIAFGNNSGLDYNTWLGNLQLTFATNLNTRITDDCSILDVDSWDYEPKTPFDVSCGTREVVFTVSDSCGNQATWNASYTIMDTILPILVGVPNDTVVGCESIPAPPNVTVMDNCENNLTATLTETDNRVFDGSCKEFEYTIRRVWTVSDSCNNTTVAEQIITVEDNNPPTFTVPPNVTIACDQDEQDLNLTGGILDAMDECGGPISISFSDSKQVGSCDQDTIITRGWEVVDRCGNPTIKFQTITKTDDIAPTFTVPADTLVDCSVAEDLDVTGRPTEISDNCDADPMVTHSDVIVLDPLCESKYTIRRTWSVTDQCGNTTSLDQEILVEDLMAPVFDQSPQGITITCADDLDINNAFVNWYTSRANAIVSDNCSDTSNLVWNVYNAGTLDPPSLNGFICPSNSDTVLLRSLYFVVEDECGNQVVDSAAFTVIDLFAPQIIDCQEDTTIGTSPGVCSAVFGLKAPTFTEDCALNIISENLTIEEDLTSDAEPGEEGNVPVNPLEINFQINTPIPINVFSDGILQIDLVNADAESDEEYLNVFGENNTLLGITNKSDQSCGESTTMFTIPKSDLDLWLSDGTISIRLEPNIPSNGDGRAAINALCPGGTTVRANIDLSIQSNGSTNFEYRIDGNDKVAASFAGVIEETFDQGQHLIEYFISDCAGNVDSCSFILNVEDIEAPNFSCSDDISIVLEEGACTTSTTLPFISQITDNCSSFSQYQSTLPTDTMSAWITFSEDPNLNDFLAETKQYVFSEVAANAIEDVSLSLDLRGDFNTNDAFVEIFDENGNRLGATAVGVADCDTPGQVTLFIPRDSFNLMAGDGQYAISIVPKDITVPPGVLGDGINPCNPSAVTGNGQVDSVSYIFASIQYARANPSFFTTGATETPLTLVQEPTVNPTLDLNSGTTEVFYILGDLSGNVDTCSYNIDVIDNEPPEARCQITTIFINPSGFDEQSISPMEIDAGSTDNCGIDTMFLNPNTFTCDEAGSTITGVLTVMDVAGNSSTCSSFIRIEAEAPEPTANSGLCGGDTLFLFANPPEAVGGVVFTYRWYNPNNLLISTQENHFIPNIDADDAGPYRVEIQGVTGCTAEGVVQVAIEDLPLTPSINTNTNICIGDEIVLESTVVPGGNDVVYRWYEGLPPNGTLIQSTSVPQLTLPPISQASTLNFYLTIEADGCISMPSTTTSIQVSEIPIAVVQNSDINICEGEMISLGSTVSGDGITYQWTGPNGFSSDMQFPAVIENTSLANAGVYSLVVLRNGCASSPAFTVVNIRPKAPKPTLINNGPLCVGEKLILTTDNEEASFYTWINPNGETFFTDENQFEIDNVGSSITGNWSVFVTQFDCDSDMSDPGIVIVNPLPNTTASATQVDICEGSTLELSGGPDLPGAIYQWTGPDAFTSNLQNPEVVNFSPVKAGTYTLNITTLEGCSKESSIDIGALNNVSINAVSNDGPACLTGATDIRLVSTVFPLDDGSYVYSWDGPNGFTSSDSIAIIPNASSLNNGNYSLQVTNGDGCVSNIASTTVDVMDPPTTPMRPVLGASSPAPLCIGDEIFIESDGYIGNEVTYHWETPTGLTTTELPILNVGQGEVTDNGPYNVFVTVDGCRSEKSRDLILTINTIPEVTAISNSPVCSGADIEILAFSEEGATFQWSGPSGFSSSRVDPKIDNADTSRHIGNYVVTSVVNGCKSAPFSLDIQVKQTPPKPIVDNSGPVCISTQGEILRLSVDSISAFPNAFYTWYDNFGALGTEISSTSFGLKDYSKYAEGVFEFTTRARVDNCVSELSEPTLVTFNEIPETPAFAGEDQEVCFGNSIELNALAPSIGSGEWKLIGGDSVGVMIIDKNMENTLIEGLKGEQNYLFQWTLSNGACKDYSSDEVLLNVVNPEKADAGESQLVCDEEVVTLMATSPSSGQGIWSQSNAQLALGVEIENTSDPGTIVSGLEPGNLYAFRWTITGSCGTSFEDVIIRVSDPAPFAGLDELVCNDDASFNLSATIPLDGSSGVWSSLTEGPVIEDESDPNSFVTGLLEGTNTFIWTIDEAICGASSIDTIHVDYFRNPKAENDEFSIGFGEKSEFNIFQNDFIPKESLLNIIESPASGIIIDLGEGNFEYTPNMNFVGSDQFTYEICSEGCECSMATVTLKIGGNAKCKAPTIITPNNDGINDELVVPCLLDLNQFPESELIIFNRWGDQVYRSQKPYKNDWSGTYNGADLPADTYFYILDFGDGTEPVNGFFAIQR